LRRCRINGAAQHCENSGGYLASEFCMQALQSMLLPLSFEGIGCATHNQIGFIVIYL
jgi:hypothetical protein